MVGFSILKNPNKEKARLLLMICTLTAHLVACADKQNLSSAQIATVTRGSIIQKVTVPGVISPNRKTQITPPYSGYIRKIYVQVGEHVSTNTPLVSIAQTLATRTEELFPLRSPFAGTVVQVMRSEGEFIEPNASDNKILRIDDLSKLFVDSAVPELEYPKLKLGQSVRIRASAATAKVYAGKITRVSQAALDKKAEWGSRSNVEFPVRIEILNSDSDIKPGMSAIVDVIPASREQVLTLRHEYIERDPARIDQGIVTLESGEKKTVTLGLQNEEMAEVLTGLNEGDRVRLVDFVAAAKNAPQIRGGGRMPRGSTRGH
jgi:multidrug efflux pump subunit AcrA (membrane-fusion protein)